MIQVAHYILGALKIKSHFFHVPTTTLIARTTVLVATFLINQYLIENLVIPIKWSFKLPRVKLIETVEMQNPLSRNFKDMS